MQVQINKFKLLIGVHLSKVILKCTDNFSRTLQKHSMSAAEGHGIAELTVATLKKMRSDKAFTQFFDVVEISRKTLYVNPATLPQKRKAPVRDEIGFIAGSHPETPGDHQ